MEKAPGQSETVTSLEGLLSQCCDKGQDKKHCKSGRFIIAQVRGDCHYGSGEEGRRHDLELEGIQSVKQGVVGARGWPAGLYLWSESRG